MNAFGVLFLIFMLDVNAEKNSSRIAASLNSFTQKFNKALTNRDDHNSVYCPFNLHLGLSLLHQGVNGETATELSKLLEVPANKQYFLESYKNFLSDITGESFNTWTCMIPGESLSIHRDYVNLAHQYFKTGTAGGSDPNIPHSDSNVQYCNRIGHRPKSIKLQIFSKAGFNSTWKMPFQNVKEGTFIISPDKKVKVTMMTLSDTLYFKEDESLEAKIIKLDYKNDGWSMVIVLPNEESSLKELETKMEKSSLDELLTGLKQHKLEISIPKFNANAFKFHSHFKFLEKMGADKLFTNEANFSGISHVNGESLTHFHLTHLLIEAFISVNETGTLAGSGTDFLLGAEEELPQLPPDMLTKNKIPPPASDINEDPIDTAQGFTANRPFLYFIIGPKNVFLYSGKYLSP